MDYQAFADLSAVPCAVLQVERRPDGCCGVIRIVSANRQYRETMGSRYWDGMLYQELVPRDPRFEEGCFRAAFHGQRMHLFVEIGKMDCWTDLLLLPMEPEREDLGCCQFLSEFTKAAEPERKSSVSVNTAEAVIKACITLMGARDFRESVGEVLQNILDLSDAYDVRILLVDHQKKRTVNFAERRSRRPWPIPNPADNVAEIPYALACTWEETVGESNHIIVRDARDMEELKRRNPDWVASMRSYGVSTLILSPLRQNEQIIGYLYIVNYDVEKVSDLKELVELMSFFLGSEISNHLLLDKLDEMSHTDELTGLNNRNAMIRRMHAMEQHPDRAPFGVANLDLNGLKTVNDTEGHEAGDRLLVRAAEALTKVFYHEDVFRIGGDEFFVIADGIDEEAFLRKLERLRGVVQKNDDLSFALGGYWSDGGVELTEAFRRADEKMYADKLAFYSEHPELRKR